MKTKTAVKEEVKEEVKQVVANEEEDSQAESLWNARKEAATVYYSDLLKKYFKNYEDLEKEEAEYRRVNAEKLKLVEAKKSLAKEVEDSWKNMLEVKKQAYEKIADAEQAYYNKLREFNEKYGVYHSSTLLTNEDFESIIRNFNRFFGF